jgi:hypothetical protein
MEYPEQLSDINLDEGWDFFISRNCKNQSFEGVIQAQLDRKNVGKSHFPT